MPDQIAHGLNISKVPIVLALIALVGVGLINYVVKLVPTGLEPKPKEKSAEGIRALFYGIEKNNLVYAQKVLSMNFDPNVHHENGYTPLAYAAMKGSVPMIDLLLRNGADPGQLTKEGDTPVELALRMGHAEAADLLKRARMTNAAPETPAPAAAAPQPATQAGG
jgi:ankyrin repeat protein